jgi:membrane fusion protein (multidrug efflux system)
MSFGLLALAGCESEDEATAAEPVLSIKAVVVKAADREVVTTYTGSLEGERQAVLYAKLAESVDSVWVDEGTEVKANQVILSLDRSGPTTRYAETEATYLNAEKNYNKMKYLYEQGAVSETEYDAARTNYEVSRANFEAVRRMVEIQTPIAGTVTSVDVSAGDFVTVGTKLATVATKDRLRVKFGINPSDVKAFRIGGRVTIKTDAVDQAAVGKIVSIASSADPDTRTFEAEALMDNAGRAFNPGMFVRISYVREELDDVLVVPRKSVLTLDKLPTAYRVIDGRAHKAVVSLGQELPGEVVVTSGLSAGDTLVTLGQDYLDDSMKVNITELNGQVQ